MEIKYIITLSLISVCWARNPFPDRTDWNFQNECLNSHNAYRARHRAPALRVDPSIVEYAKYRCNRVSQYNGLSHGHAGLDPNYGENLYWAWSGNPSPIGGSQGVKSWYDEVRQYDYNNPRFSSATGHFTQLVWRSTTSVGCARCGGRDGNRFETYVVCNYKTPGNVGSYFRQNVL